jgi:hypothetical protein
MALPVHTGTPAGTYYELLEYAEKLAQELEDAGDKTVRPLPVVRASSTTLPSGCRWVHGTFRVASLRLMQ